MQKTLWTDYRCTTAGSASPNQAIAKSILVGAGAASEGERFGPMPAAIQDRTEHLLKRPPRPHPYARVHHDVRGQYYDFKARPELVGTALEDFVSHRDCAGTDELFALLRHIDRKSTHLNSSH